MLDLVLELGVANENIAVLEALERYFQGRFEPEGLNHRELSPEERAGKKDGSGKLWLEQNGQDFRVQIPFEIPVIFELIRCKKEPFTASETAYFERAIKSFNERILEIARLKGLSFTDDLTGLFNQRYLEVILDRELSLAKRNDVQFSVLFLDMDHFKQVNDRHGHLIGSRLLYEVGQEIKRTLRESDITFRYGGDEFLIILAHTCLDDAVVVAERIRQQVEKKRFLAREGLDIRLTASIGVASVPEHACTKQEILRAADEALYGVKRALRNKVIAATVKAKE